MVLITTLKNGIHEASQVWPEPYGPLLANPRAVEPSRSGKIGAIGPPTASYHSFPSFSCRLWQWSCSHCAASFFAALELTRKFGAKFNKNAAQVDEASRPILCRACKTQTTNACLRPGPDGADTIRSERCECDLAGYREGRLRRWARAQFKRYRISLRASCLTWNFPQ